MLRPLVRLTYLWKRFIMAFRPAPVDRPLVEELRAEFQRLLPALAQRRSDAEDMWIRHRIRLRELVLERDLREFLRWDVIKATMVISNTRYAAEELRYLKRQPNWKHRWLPAIRESPVGRPRPFHLHPESSGTLIHHAYHVCRFEVATGISLDKASLVVEFGGGYGSACRLVHQLGFRGTYVLFDLPEFAALQRFFLRSLNIPVSKGQGDDGSRARVITVSKIEALRTLVRERDAGNRVFIATWSLSETALAVRETILREVASFDGFLIAYQARFGEVDNVGFFQQWKSRMPARIAWHECQIVHLQKNSWYLFGVDHTRNALSSGRLEA